MALRDLTRKFAFVWENRLFAEGGHECVKVSSCHVYKVVFFASGQCSDDEDGEGEGYEEDEGEEEEWDEDEEVGGEEEAA